MTGKNRSLTFATLGLSILLTGCADDAGRLQPAPTQPIIPTAPSPTIAPTGTLHGVVFELTPNGREPVGGVEVYCESCIPPFGHTLTATGVDGRYSFDGTTSGAHLVMLSKPGYSLPRSDWTGPGGIGWMGGVYAAVSGDTVFDIELIRQ